MVRAILEGRKTQTRRVLTPQNSLFNGTSWTKLHKTQKWNWDGAWVDPGPSPVGNPGPYLKLPWLTGDDDIFDGSVHRIYPMTQPGDRLWVREAWARTSIAPILDTIENPVVVYRECDNRCDYGGPWRPSIHMPRWASRITLEVTEVRVQRLQEIGEEDAEAEGWPAAEDRATAGVAEIRDAYPIGWFAALWDGLNAKRGYGWDVNPWIVALTFEPSPRPY
jgi:hypothetical protein